MAKPVSLRDAREKLKLKQSDIAVTVGVTQASVSHWESLTTIPPTRLWDAIAGAYSISWTDVAQYFRGAA